MKNLKNLQFFQFLLVDQWMDWYLDLMNPQPTTNPFISFFPTDP